SHWWYFAYHIECFVLFFFFQAEDGIRDKLVTGVQTCALPILVLGGAAGEVERLFTQRMARDGFGPAQVANARDAWRDYLAARSQIGRASCRERRGDGGGEEGLHEKQVNHTEKSA